MGSRRVGGAAPIGRVGVRFPGDFGREAQIRGHSPPGGPRAPDRLGQAPHHLRPEASEPELGYPALLDPGSGSSARAPASLAAQKFT